jgi:hypothetical protein
MNHLHIHDLYNLSFFGPNQSYLIFTRIQNDTATKGVLVHQVISLDFE